MEFSIRVTFIILVSLGILASNSHCQEWQKIFESLNDIDDGSTHFDEDTIRDTLEDIKDRIHDFVTSPSYDLYWGIFIEKAAQLMKHVDKRTIKLAFDLVSKNPELATKLYEIAQRRRQEQLSEAIRKGDMKIVTDWIQKLTTSKNPMDMIQTALDSVGIGKAKNASDKATPPGGSKFSSSTTKHEL